MASSFSEAASPSGEGCVSVTYLKQQQLCAVYWTVYKGGHESSRASSSASMQERGGCESGFDIEIFTSGLVILSWLNLLVRQYLVCVGGQVDFSVEDTQTCEGGGVGGNSRRSQAEKKLKLGVNE